MPVPCHATAQHKHAQIIDTATKSQFLRQNAPKPLISVVLAYFVYKIGYKIQKNLGFRAFWTRLNLALEQH